MDALQTAYNHNHDNHIQYQDDQLDRGWKKANREAKKRRAEGKPMIKVVYYKKDQP